MANNVHPYLSPALRHWTISPFIYDSTVRERLLEAANKPSDYEPILDELNRQIVAAQGAMLYPDQPISEAGVADTYLYQMIDNKRERLSIAHGWLRLVSDAANVAEKLYSIALDFHPQEPVDRRTRTRSRAPWIAHTIHALGCMLEARLYTLRAWVNERSVLDNPDVVEVEDVLNDVDVQNVNREVRRAIHDYHEQVKLWLKHLDGGRSLPSGWIGAGDTANFHQWAEDFLVLREQELGWVPVARKMSRDLRYASHVALLQQRRDEARRADSLGEKLGKRFAATVLGMHGDFNGWGLRPRRLFIRVIAVILVSAVFYFVNDGIYPTTNSIDLQVGIIQVHHIQIGTGWAHCKSVGLPSSGMWPYLYYAIVNLTGLGILREGPCGPMTGVLISVESAFGYILLALFIQTVLSSVDTWVKRVRETLRP